MYVLQIYGALNRPVLIFAAALQKEKEDLDDVSNELELADEEALIP